jgi:hypothetical protein
VALEVSTGGTGGRHGWHLGGTGGRHGFSTGLHCVTFFVDHVGHASISG